MPTAKDAPYKVAQSVSRVIKIYSRPASPSEDKSLRKASGLSARQWKRQKAAYRRATEKTA